MFCGKCGSKIEDNSVFCPECGEKIEDFQLLEDDGTDDTINLDAINLDDDFNEETDILEPIEEDKFKGLDVTTTMPSATSVSNSFESDNVAAFSTQPQIPQNVSSQGVNGSAASATTNKTPIIVGASIAGVLLIVLALWLFAFGGLGIFTGQTAIGDQLKSHLLSDTEFTSKVVKDKFTFHSDPSIKYLNIKEDTVEDKGSDWEKHYVTFSGESESNYYASSFSGSARYTKRGNDITIDDGSTNINVDKITPTHAPDSVTEDADIPADGGDLVDDSGTATATIKGDESVKDYWFGQEVHKTEVKLVFDKDEGWMVKDRHVIEGSSKMRVDLNGKKFNFTADMMDSKLSHEVMNRYYMVMHAECVPEMELTFDSVDDNGNAKAKLTIKQESKGGNEQDMKTTCFSTLHSDHDSNNVTFDKIDATIDLTGKFEFGTSSGVKFTASGTPTGTFTTVDGNSANLSLEATENNEDSVRFKLISNLRYHSTKSLYRQFFFDKLKFVKVEEKKSESNSTKTNYSNVNSDSGQFSWIQKYNGKTYVASYDDNFAKESKGNTSEGEIEIPVDTGKFRIVDDKIVYLTPNESQGAETIRLKMCDLDGKNDTELFSVELARLDDAYIYNGQVYCHYSNISQTGDLGILSVNISDKSSKTYPFSDPYERVVGFTEGYAWTCLEGKDESAGILGGSKWEIAKIDVSSGQRDVVKTLTSMSPSLGVYQVIRVDENGIYVSMRASGAGSTVYVHDLEGNEKQKIDVGVLDGWSTNYSVAYDGLSGMIVAYDERQSSSFLYIINPKTGSSESYELQPDIKELMKSSVENEKIVGVINNKQILVQDRTKATAVGSYAGYGYDLYSVNLDDGTSTLIKEFTKL